MLLVGLLLFIINFILFYIIDILYDYVLVYLSKVIVVFAHVWRTWIVWAALFFLILSIIKYTIRILLTLHLIIVWIILLTLTVLLFVVKWKP